jgi:hypothetical protein
VDDWIEERPQRILWPMLILWAAGAIIFTYAGYQGAMMPTAWLTARPDAKAITSVYPQFQPMVYALENAVPVLKLGMDERWMPNGAEVFRQPWCGMTWLPFLSTYWFLCSVRWGLILFGWVQALVLSAALAARFKR